MTLPVFQKKILEWFRKNGRHDLPWRPPSSASAKASARLRRDGTADPYKVLVSEIMLQQTQVDRVVGYYKVFLRAFPTVRKLAVASPADVLAVWKGLGYNRRALYLKRAAEMIVREYRGRFPRAVADIEKLPGVGHYTARAVSVFAFNTPETFIETNIRRVFIHFFGNVIQSSSAIPSVSFVIPAKAGIQSKNNLSLDSRLRGNDKKGDGKEKVGHWNKRNGTISDKELMPLVEKTLYHQNPRLWYNALMDYGALALSSIANPNRRSHHYAKQSRFEGSRRYARAKILDFLLKKKSCSLKDFRQYFEKDTQLHAYVNMVEDLLRTLMSEGFLRQEKGRWALKS